MRTPDEAFVGIPDYPFEARWHDWDGHRIHFVDEGSGPPVVLFHGEPTWSFLYRKVIPVLVDRGYRAIAPDYVGFGKSDKPTDPDWYTYDNHVATMASLLDHLDVTNATAVVQDWGGPIGLRLATEMSHRFDRLTIMNTGVSTGRSKVSEGFMAWRTFVENTPDLPIGFIMGRSAVTEWPAEVFAAYEAPFPDASYKVGAHRFPLIVPIAEDHTGANEMQAVADALTTWDKPTQVLFSTEDPIFNTRVGERFVERIPGATALELIENAGHFLQEDQGEVVAGRIADFLDRTT
ncbi:MAG: alpha/beta fold hydrolase [Acidimicrobiia bacterium]|nr:alpha/beta fold hydrolase [Acidimicrobiia bacterium]NNF68369.1 alpha/beta fold hydrolase [Acidimicrobiia bacterium]NNK91890.1 alpha/beta fold hydrolase [Acidimicrobiia bacterium]